MNKPYIMDAISAGILRLAVDWLEPQQVTIEQRGSTFVFTYVDQLGRRRLYVSRYVGFDVSEFIAQDKSKFIVLGNWAEALYQDYSGRWRAVEIVKLSTAE